MKFILQIFALGIAAMTAAGSLACEAGAADCVEVGRWDVSVGVGLGVRTNPVEGGDNFPLVLIPQVNYNGERFFLQNLDVGWILVESETQQLNLLATPSYDQVFFDRWNPANFFTDTNAFFTAGARESGTKSNLLPQIEVDTELVTPAFDNAPRRELRNRRTAGLAGIEYQFSLAALDIQLQYLREFTGLHHGDELRLSIARHWVSGRHHVIGSLGAVWQSSDVVNYYYGVTPAEADARGTYTAGSGVSGIARIDWNYELTERWDLRLLTSFRQLPDEISASPLVDDDKVITVFVGGVYHF